MPILPPGDREKLAENVRNGLRTVFGSPAEAVVRAPAQVKLISDHGDELHGRVLTIALPHCAYAAVALRDDDVVRVHSTAFADEAYFGTMSGLGPGQVTGWPAYVTGVLWALREEGLDVRGMDLYLDSSIPIHVGLSSSAAVAAAVAMATMTAMNLRPTPEVRDLLVRACVRSSNQFALERTHGLDEIVAIYAQPGTAMLFDIDAGSRTVMPLPLTGHRLVITDTHTAHYEHITGKARRCVGCESLTPPITHQGLAQIADALKQNDWRELRTLFADSHQVLRDVFKISNLQLDLVVDTALAAGAKASRMSGHGSEGLVVSVVPAGMVNAVTTEIDNTFGAMGYAFPTHVVAEPSGATATMR